MPLTDLFDTVENASVLVVCAPLGKPEQWFLIAISVY